MKKYIYAVASLLLLFSIILPIFYQSTYAAVPQLEHIRVALFIDARGTVPSVTLSSNAGLQVGARHPDGVRPWFNHHDNTPIRSSMNQYMLLIQQTEDLNAASRTAQKIESASGEAYVMIDRIGGKTVYQVYVGQFSSEGQAMVARDRIAGQLAVQGSSIQITGPLHWNAGTFGTIAEAEQLVKLISDRGFKSHLVYHENDNGELVYSAWVGEVTYSLYLDELKNELKQAMPHLILQPANTDQPYLLVREQVQAGATVPHYFANTSGHKIWITPASAEERIRIHERSNRMYRGSIEITQHNNRLAVINEVPFEQYLYSVVGSELSSSWPMEALKAQAVAARTFALDMGMKYNIAHVSDTTFEQAYYGAGAEFTAAINAVNATAGEVVVNAYGGLITAFYYSNAGGMTADASEIWGNPLDYIQVVPSPDQIAEEGLLPWNRVVLPNGTVGYVRSDYTNATSQTTASGLPILTANASNVNVRQAPFVNNETNPAIAQLQQGQQLVLIEQMMESNAYSWMRGPFTANQLRTSINRVASQPLLDEIQTLEVSQRGPSGRVIEMKANGQVIQVNTPDSYRSALNGVLSTRFDVEETGRYTILGANNRTTEKLQQNEALHVISGSSSQSQALNASEMLVMNDQSDVRLITKDLQFRIIGLGFGHGIGMSQWGARDLAEYLGYDYQQILKYYYNNVSIVKG